MHTESCSETKNAWKEFNDFLRYRTMDAREEHLRDPEGKNAEQMRAYASVWHEWVRVRRELI